MREWFVRYQRAGGAEKIVPLEVPDLRTAITDAGSYFEMYTNLKHVCYEIFVLFEAESDGKDGYIPGTGSTVIDIRAEALCLGRPTRPSEKISLGEYLLEEYCGIITNQQLLDGDD